MTAQRNIGLTSLTTADRRWIEGMMRRLLAELLPTDDEMLTTEKVCEITGNKPAWITRHKHELGAVKVNGRNYVPRRNLMNYLNNKNERI